MATADPIPELTTAPQHSAADLLIMVAAMLPEQFETLLTNLAAVFPPEGLLIATESAVPAGAHPSFRIVAAPQGNAGWSLTASNFVHAYDLSQEHEARAILILGPGSESLHGTALRELASAVLTTTTDLAVPRYALPPHAGIINAAILYPLTRALFATRVRFPLAVDLGLSSRMVQRLAGVAQHVSSADQAETLVWPVSEAAVAGFGIEEFDVGARNLPQPAGGDINSLLARVVGSLFADIEAKAAYWQRARRPPPPRRLPNELPLVEGATDVPHMVEAFRFAYSNLLEIWSLVLPPHSLLELKRLTTMGAMEFRMPSSLWARIVFDFLVAYRLRTINRSHLLGAFIPLYLGWVAGHINTIAAGTSAEAHIDGVAGAFEADKPYLVARWRWPDRFNA